LGTGPINVEYETISDPSFGQAYYIIKETGERVPYQYTGTRDDIKIYKAPDFLDPVSLGEWERINKEIQDILTGKTEVPLQGPRAQRLGDLTHEERDVEAGTQLEQYITFLQQRQRRLMSGQSESTEPPYSGEGAGPAVQPGVDPGTTDTSAQDAIGTAPGGGNAQAVANDQLSAEDWLKQNADPTQYVDPTTGEAGLGAWMKERNRRREKDATTQANVEGPQAETQEKTAAEFLSENPDPTQYTNPTTGESGLGAWMKERDRLRQVERDTPQTETTPDQEIEADPRVDKFLDDILANAGELSPEEEATLRREVQAGVQKALSGISARGLGRSSEALGVITQGAIAEETAVGAAKRDVREKGQQLQLRAAEIMTNRTEADRNYDLAVKSGNLDSLKNAQNQTLLQRAQQLDWSKFEESKKQLEREFGLALDDAELRKFIATGELTMKAIDLDQTNTFRNQNMANEFLLTVREQDIQQHLGLSKLDVEKWIAGENIGVEKMSLALQRAMAMAGIDVETMKIQAMMEMAKEGDGIGAGDVVGWLMTGIKFYMASQTGGASATNPVTGPV
jgi:hypothetical protein